MAGRAGDEGAEVDSSCETEERGDVAAQMFGANGTGRRNGILEGSAGGGVREVDLLAKELDMLA